jgi:hypothetical protein
MIKKNIPNKKSPDDASSIVWAVSTTLYVVFVITVRVVVLSFVVGDARDDLMW